MKTNALTFLLARAAVAALLAAGVAVAPAAGQSLNIDVAPLGVGPPHTYAAAGEAGVWNAIPAANNTTTENLIGLDGVPTAADLQQIGGLDLVTVDDPATTGADGMLMDDYLVTFDDGLETCIFLLQMIPGEYEVLIYAWMPAQPAVLSDAFVDQEPGVPHYSVGGAWPGGHQELVTYSRHTLTVGANGNLYLHSGIVPGANELDGAALNGLQVRNLAEIFKDGFEVGDASRWVVTSP
jgi:hypothetical protein